MRLIACALLLSGFFVVLAALALFGEARMRFVFVVAGLGVEVLGVGLLTRTHTLLQKEQR